MIIIEGAWRSRGRHCWVMTERYWVRFLLRPKLSSRESIILKLFTVIDPIKRTKITLVVVVNLYLLLLLSALASSYFDLSVYWVASVVS